MIKYQGLLLIVFDSCIDNTTIIQIGERKHYSQSISGKSAKSSNED